MFSGVAEVSAEGALLVVMTINRDFLVRHFAPEGAQAAEGITIHETRRLDLETSRVFNTWEFSEGTSEEGMPLLSLDFDNRVYSLHEMRELVEQCGWNYRNGYGSQSIDEVRLAPLDMDTSRMWIVAQK